ncbi:hypothetical protein L873DRAFT_1786091 [Choiromyces venosus 120613-1]|uniref:Uncharacterized protein n=1 Tax=Choiromyces venosus 120613-1 TaxID=1336337 RepID=A0A3N4K2Z2_9PEZI|nr:hypothetical protein L873DRAFT_1786091 [Choiromyces venosus 120613-1]
MYVVHPSMRAKLTTPVGRNLDYTANESPPSVSLNIYKLIPTSNHVNQPTAAPDTSLISYSHMALSKTTVKITLDPVSHTLSPRTTFAQASSSLQSWPLGGGGGGRISPSSTTPSPVCKILSTFSDSWVCLLTQTLTLDLPQPKKSKTFNFSRNSSCSTKSIPVALQLWRSTTNSNVERITARRTDHNNNNSSAGTAEWISVECDSLSEAMNDDSSSVKLAINGCKARKGAQVNLAEMASTNGVVGAVEKGEDVVLVFAH